MGYRFWPWETMPRCGMPCVVGYPNVGIPCRKGSSLWPYRAAGDTVSLRRPSEVLASVKRCAGLTVRWRSGVPAHRVHRARLGAALRGLAPLPPGAQPLPCCNTPCCNAAHPVATSRAILQHSARSCNILRVRAFVGYACAHPAAQHATCRAAHDMGRRGASHPLYVPHGIPRRRGIPCRMGYRAAWDTAPHGVSVDQCGAGARRGVARYLSRRAGGRAARGGGVAPHTSTRTSPATPRRLVVSRLAALPLSRSPA